MGKSWPWLTDRRTRFQGISWQGILYEGKRGGCTKPLLTEMRLSVWIFGIRDNARDGNEVERKLFLSVVGS